MNEAMRQLVIIVILLAITPINGAVWLILWARKYPLFRPGSEYSKEETVKMLGSLCVVALLPLVIGFVKLFMGPFSLTLKVVMLGGYLIFFYLVAGITIFLLIRAKKRRGERLR
ncbi:hypothetical protein DRQ20_04945 [bacterium]|mgnify:CR=1 FL=1|nr:MAG: hypothetical protein DRQ20_04945 [bacterium]